MLLYQSLMQLRAMQLQAPKTTRGQGKPPAPKRTKGQGIALPCTLYRESVVPDTNAYRASVSMW